MCRLVYPSVVGLIAFVLERLFLFDCVTAFWTCSSCNVTLPFGSFFFDSFIGCILLLERGKEKGLEPGNVRLDDFKREGERNASCVHARKKGFLLCGFVCMHMSASSFGFT